MKNTLKIITILTIIVLIFSFNVVNAQTGILAKVVTDKIKMKAGETVNVTVSITNIDESLDGVAGFEGVIDFSSSVFEDIDLSNFKNKNGWSVLGYEKSTGHFTVINSGFVKTDQEMFTVTLTAKKDIAAGRATINFTDLKTTALQSDIILSSKSVTLDLVSSSTGSDNNPSSSNTTNQNNTSSDNNVIENDTSLDNTINQNNTKDNVINNNGVNGGKNVVNTNTSVQTRLPAAGLETVAPIIVLVIITGYIFYIKNKNIQIQ